MKALIAFSDILTALSRVWNSRNKDQCFLSLALPIAGIDPLYYLPILAKEEQFRFLWDLSPDHCLAASGKCQYQDLSGARRFELAKRFTASIFERLLDVTPDSSVQALPRILFAFSFFEQVSETKEAFANPPSLQAVFPRWQLTRDGDISWLRINGVALHYADLYHKIERQKSTR